MFVLFYVGAEQDAMSRTLVEVRDVHHSPLRIRGNHLLWFITEDEDGVSLPVGLFDLVALAEIHKALGKHLERFS